MHEPVLATKLRRLTVAACVLAAILIAVAFLPGTRVYGDSNGCLGRIFVTEGHGPSGPCDSRYDEVLRDRHAGGVPLVIFALASALPALLVWRRPTRRAAWMWLAWMPAALIGAGVLWFALEFELDLFDQTRMLWPGLVALVATLAMLVLGFVVVPMTLTQTPKPPHLPEARAL